MTLEISDALNFFRLSCGRWKSQRSQHQPTAIISEVKS